MSQVQSSGVHSMRGTCELTDPALLFLSTWSSSTSSTHRAQIEAGDGVLNVLRIIMLNLTVRPRPLCLLCSPSRSLPFELDFYIAQRGSAMSDSLARLSATRACATSYALTATHILHALRIAGRWYILSTRTRH